MDQKSNTAIIDENDANIDPLSGEPGAHPVGVGAGAAGGAATGALIGTAVGGPIGAGIGAVVGGIAGGYAGKAAAEAVNPTVEHKYWRSEYVNRPYFTPGASYDQYGPAYQYGWESYAANRTTGKTFEQVEPQLKQDWESRLGKSKLSWDHAKNATRDAWSRVDKNHPDSCGC